MNKEFYRFIKLYENQREAAKALGMSEAWVSQVLHGHRKMSPESALRVEQVSKGAVKKTRLIWNSTA